jgi:hypothetical protein
VNVAAVPFVDWIVTYVVTLHLVDEMDVENHLHSSSQRLTIKQQTNKYSNKNKQKLEKKYKPKMRK